MQNSMLGHTALAVSRLAFGAMTFTAGNRDMAAISKVGARPGLTRVLPGSTQLADQPSPQASVAPSAGPAASGGSGGTGHREAVLGRKRR